MRRLALFSVVLIALPLLFVFSFSAGGKAGPRSQLVSSWIDSDGVGHLNFDVSGMHSGDIVTAALVLHRPPSSPAAAIHVAVVGGTWATTAGWPRQASSTKPETVSDALQINVSDAIRGNGPMAFAITSITPTAAPDVVVSAAAGAAAPTLLLKISGGSGTISNAAAATTVKTPDATDPTATGEWTSADSGSAPSSSSTSQSPPTWQSLWVDLVPPAAGSGSSDWIPAPGQAGCSVSALLVPACGIWWGVGANPSPGQSWDQAMADFDTNQARGSDLLHYYHVGSALFPTQVEIDRAHAGGQNRVLLENWKPELGRTWAQVAAGDPAVDAEIDHEAAYLRTSYTAKFFLAIHHEPENEVNPAAGSGYTAADYAAMYRHVVLRLRADGVTNAVYVVDYMGAPKWGEQPWFNALYPGDDVVDWIAEDPYSVGSSPQWRADFAGMVNRRDGSSWPGFYTWATTSHPGKPIMLAEWGVTEDPANAAAKTDFFAGMLAELRDLPAIKALVYWDAPGSGNSGTSITSDASALAAFRTLAAASVFQVQTP